MPAASPDGRALTTPCRLGAGDYTVRIGPGVTGTSWWRDHALTSGPGDRLEDPDGLFVALRDVDAPDAAAFGFFPGARHDVVATARDGHVRFVAVHDGIEAEMDVCVAPVLPAELRRVTVRNRGDRTRRIEFVSFASVVLNHPAAHAAHPVFSKLFLQTESVPDDRALLVRRRPRSPEEASPWMAHALVERDPVGFETSRDAFVGRGGSVHAPRALRGAASPGATGNVLDPLVSLRDAVALAPGGEACATFVLAAAPDRDAVLAVVRALRAPGAVDAAFASADVADMTDATAHGRPDAPPIVASGAAMETAPLPPPPSGAVAAGPLELPNGLGGFADDGREYVLRLRCRGRRIENLPPRPWTNVIASERFGFLVSETGAGCVWSGNSREHRLTPWSNDPLLDPHGDALWLRDDDTGAVWSPLPGPLPAPGDYEVRHGLGFSAWRHETGGLAEETVMFAAGDDPVRVTTVTLTNRGGTPRRLAVFAGVRPVLGASPADTAASLRLEVDADAILARNPDAGPFAAAVAFAAVVPPEGPHEVQCGTDRDAFQGRTGAFAAPDAVLRGTLGGHLAGNGAAHARGEPFLAHRVGVTLAPGARVEISFLLGEGDDEAHARDLIGRYRAPGAVRAALAAARAAWRRETDGVRIETPSRALDVLVNAWLPYQTLSCRLNGRTAFYQSGGAYGFRDQLQDAAALAWLSPERTRAQILLHAAHQFTEGDVLHWWHTPGLRGLRTRFADDLLWLPFVAAAYVEHTGDHAVLDESVRFLRAAALDPGEDERFLEAEDSGERASVWEHCCRAIERSLAVGAHGLPLFGTGDWNDGMNRVGREGRGESVWMAFFLGSVLRDMAPLARRRGDEARARRWDAHRATLAAAVERSAWDGEWYLRAFYDDGTPLGTHAGDECRIDALVQAWSVLSGMAPPERAARAMDAAERHLVSARERLVRLLTPAFENTPHDPGYIKGYVRGVRENGGQYTHAALWVVAALARLGRRDRAARVLELLNPVHHARDEAAVARYQVEPYVVAADVYGEPPHVGRGGWTWYTGSAGWMIRACLESVLGLSVHGGAELRVAPCIPDDWPGFTVRWRVPGADGTAYVVRVTRGDAFAARLDGAPLPVARIPLVRDGAEHLVDVVLGPAS